MTLVDEDDEQLADLDLGKPLIITIIGGKGSGKSVLAAAINAEYPWDRLCIDPTQDALVGPAYDKLDQHDLPGRFPTDPEGKRQVSLLLQPDVGSSTYVDDIDRAVGLSHFHPRRRSLVWFDERDEVTTSHKTGPNLRRSLFSGRHQGQTLISCGPRAKGMDPLFLANADVLFLCGSVKSDYDRQTIAATWGLKRAELDQVLDDPDRVKYDYYRLTKDPDEIVLFPPLPRELVQQLERGLYGYQVRPPDHGDPL